MLPGKALVVVLAVVVLSRDMSSMAGGEHPKGYPWEGSTPRSAARVIFFSTGIWYRASFALPRALASPRDAWITHQIIHHPSSGGMVCLIEILRLARVSWKSSLFTSE